MISDDHISEILKNHQSRFQTLIKARNDSSKRGNRLMFAAMDMASVFLSEAHADAKSLADALSAVQYQRDILRDALVECGQEMHELQHQFEKLRHEIDQLAEKIKSEVLERFHA